MGHSKRPAEHGITRRDQSDAGRSNRTSKAASSGVASPYAPAPDYPPLNRNHQAGPCARPMCAAILRRVAHWLRIRCGSTSSTRAQIVIRIALPQWLGGRRIGIAGGSAGRPHLGNVGALHNAAVDADGKTALHAPHFYARPAHGRSTIGPAFCCARRLAFSRCGQMGAQGYGRGWHLSWYAATTLAARLPVATASDMR